MVQMRNRTFDEIEVGATVSVSRTLTATVTARAKRALGRRIEFACHSRR